MCVNSIKLATLIDKMQFSRNTSDGSFSLSLLNEDNVMLLVFKPEDSKSEVI